MTAADVGRWVGVQPDSQTAEEIIDALILKGFPPMIAAGVFYNKLMPLAVEELLRRRGWIFAGTEIVTTSVQADGYVVRCVLCGISGSSDRPEPEGGLACPRCAAAKMLG